MVASRLFLKNMQLMQGIDQGLKWKLGTNTNTKEIQKMIYWSDYFQVNILIFHLSPWSDSIAAYFGHQGF